MQIGLSLSLTNVLLSSAADFYGVGGLKPSLVFDFSSEFYRTGGSTTTFDAAMTHTRSGNATMVDSDGVLKWAPHNLLTYSEDFSNAAWSKNSTVESVGDGYIAPDGTNNATKLLVVDSGGSGSGPYIQQPLSLYSGASYKALVFAKADQTSWIYVQMPAFTSPAEGGVWFNLFDGSVGTEQSGYSGSVMSVGNGWYLCEVSFSLSTDVDGFIRIEAAAGDGLDSVSLDGATSIYIWGAHLYRSDLGGMVDNPDTGNSYVPTTSAARYLPRRGHHIYNGAEWVNEGVLVESEARTNYLLNSGTLATQDVTVTAVPHTLHFTGTGTVTLSGVSTAGPLVGTGAGENNRVSLTFTPTAGTLTLTVSGTVTNADLEIGSTPSSHIPTSGSTATRSADTITVPSANLPWPTEAPLSVSIQMDGKMTYADTDTSEEVLFSRWVALENVNEIELKLRTITARTGEPEFLQRANNIAVSVLGSTTAYSPGINVPYNIASRHGSTFINGAVDGVALTADTTPTALPDLSSTDLNLAFDYMGTIKKFRVWSDDLGDTGIAEAST
jgi:hypothetical protein